MSSDRRRVQRHSIYWQSQLPTMDCTCTRPTATSFLASFLIRPMLLALPSTPKTPLLSPLYSGMEQCACGMSLRKRMCSSSSRTTCQSRTFDSRQMVDCSCPRGTRLHRFSSLMINLKSFPLSGFEGIRIESAIFCLLPLRTNA